MRASSLHRLIGVPVAVLVANSVWAASLPSRSGQTVAVLGIVIAVAAILALSVSKPLRDSILTNPPRFLTQPLPAAAVVVPFVLPVFFLHVSPVFGFWRLDGRSALLLAWLAATVLAMTFERDRPHASPRPIATGLLATFLFFSAALWLSVVMDTGIAAFMMQIDRRGPRPCQVDPFTTMATVWESNPPSEHLFLAWRNEGDLQRGTVYANHVHPYLLSMYGWMRAVRAIGHLTWWQATNTTILFPVLVLVAGFATLLARSGRLWHRRRAAQLFSLFIAIGILITTWRLWIDLVRFNSDNSYPLLAGVLVWLYALLLPPVQTRSAAAAAALFAALSPTNTPMVILPMLCLFSHGGGSVRDVLRRNRSVLVICLAALAAGAVSYVEPRLLIRWKEYHPQESSFLFRSGLDGDTTYFTGLLQAVVAPCPVRCCYGRTLVDLLVPFSIPLAVMTPMVWWWSPSQAASVGRALLFLITPYVMTVILFPQAVSIHPYIYDHWLIVPVVVAGLLAMLSEPVDARLKGPALLGFLLLAGAVLMSNLLGLTQGLGRAIAFFRS